MTEQHDKNFEELKTEIEILGSRLTTFSREAREGTVHDLADLPQTVEHLCTALNHLPEQERKTLSIKVVGLIEELDNLSDIMRKNLSSVQQELKGNSTRHQAAKAYGKSSTIPSPKR
ncbi:hypothetical protein [Kiloniella sp. b19]|uniref:hypothetical protein n=1 Tax=Kiloniella sp. GXU_MW_B19 TaxID=3141326 RepID=UPI0031D187DB